MSKPKTKADKKKRKFKRADERRRYAEPQITATHFVRLSRPKVVIDAEKRWFVARVVARRDVRVEKNLEEAGIVNLVPVDVETIVRRGRKAEVKARPLTGYVFVALNEATNEAWAQVLAVDDVAAFVGAPEQPFEVSPWQLQRFVDGLTPPVATEIQDASGRVLARFPMVLPEADFASVEAGLAEHASC
jgi:hypothetical protein